MQFAHLLFERGGHFIEALGQLTDLARTMLDARTGGQRAEPHLLCGGDQSADMAEDKDIARDPRRRQGQHGHDAEDDEILGQRVVGKRVGHFDRDSNEHVRVGNSLRAVQRRAGVEPLHAIQAGGHHHRLATRLQELHDAGVGLQRFTDPVPV